MEAKPSIVVTGATSGIGRALAREWARRGHALGLTGRRLEVLEEVRAEIAADPAAKGADGKPVRVEVAALDVRDSEAVHRVLGDLAQRLGDVGIVVANAGIGNERRCGDGRFDKDEDIIRTNVIGAMATVDAAVELFRRAGRGQVVGISSVAAFRGLPGSAAYSASKAALINFMQCAAKDLGPHNVRVNALAPGMVKTELNQSIWAAGQKLLPESERQSFDEWAASKIKKVSHLSRWQMPEEYAAMACFLASEHAKNITGQTLNIDGGQVMHA